MRKALLVRFVAMGAAFFIFAIAVSIGPADISLAEVWRTMGHHLGCYDAPQTTLIRDRIVWDLRVPRVLLAACVGAGLALCGAILQSLTRNMLADPYLLGISSGAGAGAVTVLVMGFGTAFGLLPLGAFVGALLAFLFVLALAGRSAAGDPGPIILAGVAATYLFSALSSFLTMWYTDANATRGLLYWLLGSLSAARWPEVTICGPVLLGSLLLFRAKANALDALAFGSDTALSLGVSVAPVRMILYIATAGLAATIVAFSGAIGFVGLVVPHAVRMIVGTGHHRVLPVSALTGAVFTIIIDTIARTSFAPREMPVGVITSLIGVPVFTVILYRQIRK